MIGTNSRKILEQLQILAYLLIWNLSSYFLSLIVAQEALVIGALTFAIRSGQRLDKLPVQSNLN